jgi:hypothetical protein
MRGDFAGGTLKVPFSAESPNRTHLKAVFDVSARGINRLMKPIVRNVISRLADQAVEGDRRDLEGGYTPRAEAVASVAS